MAVPLLAIAATGVVLNAMGSFQAGQAGALSAQYNSNVAAQNAEIQRQNAAIAGQAGAQQATMHGLKARATAGAIQANEGASGVTVNQGSFKDVGASQKELGLLDAIQVRNEATKHAYGYEVQAANDEAQSKLDRFEANTKKTGSYLSASGTLLGGAGQAYNMWTQYKANTGIGNNGTFDMSDRP